MNKKIWLSSPHMGGHELRYVHRAFDENWVAPLGPNVDGFEQDIKDYLGEGVEVAAVSSGTAAIHLALVQLGVEQGDEVICQSFTFSASANPILYQGATPIFVDSEPESWNISPVFLEEAIKDRIKKGKKPKVIIAVDLYGMPFDARNVMAVAEKYEIPLIEDAAEALGSTYRGKNCGTFGYYGILSFNGNKIITTSGGGALVCARAKDKEKTIFLATQARDQAPHYQHSEIGYNYRMSNVCAGIGRGQMNVLQNRVEQRRSIYEKYKKALSGFSGIDFLEEPSGAYSNRWLTTILVHPEKTEGVTREDLRKALSEENIETRPLWKPMHLQPVFKDAPYYGNGLSEQLFEKGLCLPSGSNTTSEQQNRILKTMTAILKT